MWSPTLRLGRDWRLWDALSRVPVAASSAIHTLVNETGRVQNEICTEHRNGVVLRRQRRDSLPSRVPDALRHAMLL